MIVFGLVDWGSDALAGLQEEIASLREEASRDVSDHRAARSKLVCLMLHQGLWGDRIVNLGCPAEKCFALFIHIVALPMPIFSLFVVDNDPFFKTNVDSDEEGSGAVKQREIQKAVART